MGGWTLFSRSLFSIWPGRVVLVAVVLAVEVYVTWRMSGERRL
jgi:hypothetical protein